MFTEGFGNYVCEGDKITCEVDGFKVVARVEHDPDGGPPWDDGDGNGIVSEWTTRAKRPGERILSTDRNSHRFYDFAATVQRAKDDQWDSPPYNTGTKGDRAVRAVERDFKSMAAWCNNKWHYGYVTVTVSREGVKLASVSTGGLECNHPFGEANGALLEVANDLLDEAMDKARAKLAALCVCA
jgi:hypothetical protein